MVFESIVAELLNKVMGEYIENLDYTQLKVSLWGGKNACSVILLFDNNCVFHIKKSLLSGDLVLNDLLIKESALDVLDLPVRLEYGRLGIKIILLIY